MIKITELSQVLNYTQAFELQNEILHGQISTEQLLEIFNTFAKRQLQAEEFMGFVDASKANMVQIRSEFDCLDTAGTGGDKLGTFNISTAAAIVCAAAGVKVAKHGNRGVSSKCGSADVLEALGVKIDLDANTAKTCLEKTGIVFLFAPNFHPAFKNVAEARKIFAQRTYFNFLGPLLNPIRPKYQIVGVADQYMKTLMTEVLLKSEIENAMLISSEDGMDEISTLSPTNIIQVANGRTQNIVINPADLRLHSATLSDIQGGTAAENAAIIRNVLQGTASIQQSEIVAINAAAGLLVSNVVKTLSQGLVLAKQTLNSGLALAKLNQFIEISNAI
jgi:anthranilate phosphoribosyltransferase